MGLDSCGCADRPANPDVHRGREPVRDGSVREWHHDRVCASGRCARYGFCNCDGAHRGAIEAGCRSFARNPARDIGHIHSLRRERASHPCPDVGMGGRRHHLEATRNRGVHLRGESMRHSDPRARVHAPQCDRRRASAVRVGVRHRGRPVRSAAISKLSRPYGSDRQPEE